MKRTRRVAEEKAEELGEMEESKAEAEESKSEAEERSGRVAGAGRIKGATCLQEPPVFVVGVGEMEGSLIIWRGLPSVL